MLMPAWIVAAVLLFLLGWSDLFVGIRFDTALFLAIVALAYGFIATRTQSDEEPHAKLLSAGPVAVITAYFIGAYLDNGGVPLVQIALGQDYDIYGFGVDGLHIFMLCFTGYCGVRAFNGWMAYKRPMQLAVLAWVFVLLTSIGNRSAVSYLFVACLLVYVVRRGVSVQALLGGLVAILVFAYLFGVFGDFRLAHQIEGETGAPAEPGAVARLMRASEAFDESGFSPSWLWAYMYFVSPVANLNAAFAVADGGVCGAACDVPALVWYDLLPDVLGVRIAAWLGVQDYDKNAFLVAPDLTASTAFGSAVGEAGVIGGLAVAAAIACVGVVSLRAVRGTPLVVETHALVGTVVFFCFFENMVSYTPLIGQLVIAVASSQLMKLFGRRATGSRRFDAQRVAN